jgi:anti-sigma B factor antagonist/stage II sporulation protein AA (anti-sigma F factor antagonist)
MDFHIEHRQGPDGPVLALRGSLDASAGEELERAVRVAEADGGALTLDLSGLDFMDSTGLGVVLDADLRASEAGRRFVVVPGDGEARRVLELVSVTERLTVAEIR